MSVDVDSEMVEFYMSETLLSEHVVRAFLAEGCEPPHRDTVDREGYDFKQTKILDKAATPLPAE